jgi:carbamoyltransferase
MNILGISDGRINSGACILQDDQLKHCVSEERLTRKKQQGVFPRRSVETVLRETKMSYGDVDAIVFGGILTPNILVRSFRFLTGASMGNYKHPGLKDILLEVLEHRLGITSVKPHSIPGKVQKRLLPYLLRKDLAPQLWGKEICLVDHHHAHAASAFYTSGLRKALCITCDGMGDGVFLTVNLAEGTSIKRIHEIDCQHSLGEYYTLVTSYLGFRPHLHESKVTGLAAYGTTQKVDTPFPFHITSKIWSYNGSFGRAGLKQLSQAYNGYRGKDIAAWLQHHTERSLVRLVRHWVRKTGVRNIVLSGGVFANVKLNQRIHEIQGVEHLYVFPQMDDAGLAAGAALAYRQPDTCRLKNVFLGPKYDNIQIRQELETGGLQYEKHGNIDREVARILAQGHVIARFNGRMEYGPRALGNRSILYRANDPSVNDWLNRRLGRTEFMPFAPAVLSSDASKCFTGVAGAEEAARFMTITLNCTKWMKTHCSGVVHVDGTARPQLVRKQENPSFHRLITEYKQLTGLPCVINTSFNMHGEPIVCAPSDAICTFDVAGLDYLAIGDFLVKRKT